MGVITCSHMPDTTKPMAKPARPDAKPPMNAPMRNSPRTMASMARSHDRGEQRLDGEVHLEGRPRCPLLCNVGQRYKKSGPSRHHPLLAKETVLGPLKPAKRGDRRRPRFISFSALCSGAQMASCPKKGRRREVVLTYGTRMLPPQRPPRARELVADADGDLRVIGSPHETWRIWLATQGCSYAMSCSGNSAQNGDEESAGTPDPPLIACPS